MVEIHKMILPFKKWALVTGIAFVICTGFAIADYNMNLPAEPTETIEEPTETMEEPSE